MNPVQLIVVLLLVLFTAFKLAGVITWSWLWVLSPLWIWLSVVVFIVVGAVILGILSGKIK